MVSTWSSTKEKQWLFLKKSQIILVSWTLVYYAKILEELFGKLKEQIIENFEKKFTVQNHKIVYLEEKIALQEKKTENRSVKYDNNEQYSKRYCLRMHT